MERRRLPWGGRRLQLRRQLRWLLQRAQSCRPAALSVAMTMQALAGLERGWRLERRAVQVKDSLDVGEPQEQQQEGQEWKEGGKPGGEGEAQE
jgi:hypothetical protein